MNFLLRWIITCIAVSIAMFAVPGFEVGAPDSATVSLLVISAVLALLNVSIKPILSFLSFPITVLTIGLFALVINMLMLYAAVWISNTLLFTTFAITSVWSALIASIIISIVTAILSKFSGLDDVM